MLEGDLHRDRVDHGGDEEAGEGAGAGNRLAGQNYRSVGAGMADYRVDSIAW